MSRMLAELESIESSETFLAQNGNRDYASSETELKELGRILEIMDGLQRLQAKVRALTAQIHPVKPDQHINSDDTQSYSSTNNIFKSTPKSWNAAAANNKEDSRSVSLQAKKEPNQGKKNDFFGLFW